ncbi:hypothetical protein D3C76_1427720 [compost metagenome]
MNDAGSAGGRQLNGVAGDASDFNGVYVFQVQQAVDSCDSGFGEVGAVGGQGCLQVAARYGVIVLHFVFLLLQAIWPAAIVFCSVAEFSHGDLRRAAFIFVTGVRVICSATNGSVPVGPCII